MASPDEMGMGSLLDLEQYIERKLHLENRTVIGERVIGTLDREL